MIKLNKIFLVLLMAVKAYSPASALALNKYSYGSLTAAADTMMTVPLGGNAWRDGSDTTGGNISNQGIVNWTNKEAAFTVYVRIARRGSLHIWLDLSVPDGRSTLAVSALKTTRKVSGAGSAFAGYYAGRWLVADTGYTAIHVKAVSKTGGAYGDVKSIRINGSAIDNRTAFVKNNEGDFFYWGRRGPSVHVGYVVPGSLNAEWFYNEVTVPEGSDVLHAYFMADGFAEGYFGMQVNSATERRILFSVWSPFNTDKPGDIPDDQKIVLVKKGPDVHTGEFGNEGAGGQSYLVYNWKAGNTYKFLLHAKPDSNGHTVYTAYFFVPGINSWRLIASFSRPPTQTYLKHLHSFSENFEPEQGIITRQVFFANQWVADINGAWTELNKARFTIDNTGAKGYRLDYAGGVRGDAFYLKNCGFFNHYTVRNSLFERELSGKLPKLNLRDLPEL